MSDAHEPIAAEAEQPVFTTEQTTNDAPAESNANQGLALNTNDAPAENNANQGVALNTNDAPAENNANQGLALNTNDAPAENNANQGLALNTNDAPAESNKLNATHESTADRSGNDIPVVVSDHYHPTLPFYTYPITDCFRLTLSQDNPKVRHDGIKERDVPKHRKELGDNVIPVKGGPNIFKMLLGHFFNSITLILGAVAIVSAILEDWGEFGVVVFVILFNGLLGFYQEYSAEKSLQGLKSMTAGSAKVVRSGQVQVIPIDDVVVGDVVILEQGASVPADLRLFEVANLDIDEALLTGEALPVTKHTDQIPDENQSCALGDRKNMAFRNTLVTQGRGKGVVVAGGLHTEMGKLADRLNESTSNKTDLQRKMEYMMYALFGVCLVLVLIVFAANNFVYSNSTLLYACAVAIAILPESLVAVITVAMTISVRRMAQQRCIVRKLGALEVLGNVTDICSDKTGTLTENKMVIKMAFIGMDECYHVAGSPHSMYGAFVRSDESGDKRLVSPQLSGSRSPGAYSSGPGNDHIQRVEMAAQGRMYRDFFRCAALCSSTHLYPDEEKGQSLTGTGNPTEIAIQVMTWKAQLNREVFVEEEHWETVGEYAFDSGVKRMSVVFRSTEDPSKVYSCTKGAPERILNICKWHLNKEGELVDFTEQDLAEQEENVRQLAARGLRTICLAHRNLEAAPITMPENHEERYDKNNDRDTVEDNLVFLGIVGIYDPPRPESAPSVHICQGAGIKVRMLTGDHTATASAIAESLGIIDDMVQDQDKVMAGPDLDKMPDKEADELEDMPSVVGRCSPESKVKMIEALHRRNRIVAMTGDGFNDSPSIKKADIGCAMGSGTDVTKGVADIVITDDNFTTIVKAVAEGRRIADCIRKFVVHLLSGNVAEVIVLILGLPIRIHGRSVFILSPIEILWLNMFTGSPPATGLSLDAADDTILHVPPNTKGFFTKELILDTFCYGIFLGVCSLSSFIFVFYGGYDGHYEPADEDNSCNSRTDKDGCLVAWTARATAFSVLYMGLMLHAYNVRNTRKSIFRIRWFDNVWLWGSVLFGIVTLVVILYVEPIATHVFVHRQLTWQWAVVGVAIIAFFVMCELYKIIKNLVDPLPVIHVPRRKKHHHGGALASSTRASFAEGGSTTIPTPEELQEKAAEEEEEDEEEEEEPVTPQMLAGNVDASDGRSITDIARANLATSFALAATHTDYE